ncbi:MAG TPA: bifunctional metallophosphatase/5'-nucleotidase [bacterium]|nr:bifunctional metallophosphatase/5'-nucleotidase [bacterium]
MFKKKILISLIVVGLLIGGYFFYQGFSKEKVTILYTNDLQGRILPYVARWVEKEEKPLVGGSAALATCLKGMRYDLLLDAGDFFQGTPEGDFTGGESVIEIMNELGYDALTIGNHEYDQGNENVKRLAELAQFPFLSANIIDEKTGERVKYAKPYIIKEIRGIRFGIFGLTTSTSICEGLRFGEVIPAAKECLKELEKKADIIIALTHLGFDEEEEEKITDYQLAESVPGIDVIIGGHYEKELHPPVISPKHKTIICQTRGNGAYLGQLDLVIDKKTKRIIKHKGRIITLWVEEYPPDEEMASLVEKYASKVRKVMDEVIGEASEAIERDPDPEAREESAIGNWQTDLMREFAGTDIALQNSFGIRGDILKGKIAKRDIYNVSPFGNTLVTMELSGEEIRQIMEESVGEAGILQVSGLRVLYDKEKSKGERILEIEIKGKPLKSKKTYSLVTNSFLAENVEPFKKGRNIKDTKVKLRDLEEEYIRSNSPIKSPGIQGRIATTEAQKNTERRRK